MTINVDKEGNVIPSWAAPHSLGDPVGDRLRNGTVPKFKRDKDGKLYVNPEDSYAEIVPGEYEMKGIK